MPIGLAFWVLMIVSLAFWGWGAWSGSSNPYWPISHGVLVFVLLFLLGWSEFGFVLHK